MIVLFMIYMIVWPLLFVFCMDCIYKVVQEIRDELRKMNGEDEKGEVSNGTSASEEGC